jgi:hypothetical protein
MTIRLRNQLVRCHVTVISFDKTFDACHIDARYQAPILQSLKEIQLDNSIVGFYQATTSGAFFNQSQPPIDTNDGSEQMPKNRTRKRTIPRFQHFSW